MTSSSLNGEKNEMKPTFTLFTGYLIGEVPGRERFFPGGWVGEGKDGRPVTGREAGSQVKIRTYFFIHPDFILIPAGLFVLLFLFYPTGISILLQYRSPSINRPAPW